MKPLRKNFLFSIVFRLKVRKEVLKLKVQKVVRGEMHHQQKGGRLKVRVRKYQGKDPLGLKKKRITRVLSLKQVKYKMLEGMLLMRYWAPKFLLKKKVKNE